MITHAPISGLGLENSSLGQKEGVPGQPRASRGRRDTHDVGAQGAEGPSAAGEQVAAVEWQEDLYVVLTVTLEEGGGCHAPASHQGAPPRPPPPDSLESREQELPRTQEPQGHKRVRVCWTGDLGAQTVLWLANFSSVWGEAQNPPPWAVLAPEGPLQDLSRKRWSIPTHLGRKPQPRAGVDTQP